MKTILDNIIDATALDRGTIKEFQLGETCMYKFLQELKSITPYEIANFTVVTKYKGVPIKTHETANAIMVLMDV